MIIISNPLRIGLPTVTRALYAPMANNVNAVTNIDIHMLAATGKNRNGATGISEPMTADTPTTHAARNAVFRSTGARRCSSAIITATHTSWFAVIVSTMRSSNSPLNPFFDKYRASLLFQGWGLPVT